MIEKSYYKWKNDMLVAALEHKTLISCQFELTGRCNLDCKMCYVHTLDHHAAMKKELSTEQWKAIFDEAYDMGMLFATLTGGECLLRPDFKELYLHLWRKGVMIEVLTNATLLNIDTILFFKEYKPMNVQISLYGVSEKGYFRVTGHKGFEKVASVIRALKEAGIDVCIAVTPSVSIKDEYIDILKFCKEKCFNYKVGEMVLIPNRVSGLKNEFTLSMDEMVELSIKQAMLNQPLRPAEYTPEPTGEKNDFQKGFRCSAGNCVCTVTWDGKMHPCPSALLGEGFDVRELGFKEAWKRTQEAAAKALLPVECVGCPYEKICVRCPTLRSPKMDGHCDPQICELTRRLVAAGVKKLPTD